MLILQSLFLQMLHVASVSLGCNAPCLDVPKKALRDCIALSIGVGILISFYRQLEQTPLSIARSLGNTKVAQADLNAEKQGMYVLHFRPSS